MCSFLGGKKLRLKKKLTVPAVSRPDASVRAVAADPDRPIWFPGSTPPEWLDGSLPGDFGFDPLGLCEYIFFVPPCMLFNKFYNKIRLYL